MGITGLIPFLEKSSKPVHVSQFSGCTVAIDSYCWLHKGAFSCADKLARGDSCDAYVHYCMKYINTLLAHNIKPILVFDGRHLPAKANTEKKRRESREVNRRRAAELMRQDKPDQARIYLRRCIDITHDMALALMRECRSRNIDCITAPYEADAQLAYLNIHNIAHIVITEDSDLLLFGCTRVLFKMDINGGGLLIEQDKLHLSMDVRPVNFDMNKFRYMCILSGCDYLPSLPGIGLVKACRFVKRTADPDIHRALSKLGSHLNMSLVVPLDYRDNFMATDAMFRHQPVFDPISRQIVPLTPLPSGTAPLQFPEKDILTPKKALQLAYGNLDPFTLEIVDDWDPDKAQPKPGKTNGWNATARAPHKSIWSADFKPKTILFEAPEPPPVQHPSTTGKEKEQQFNINTPTPKRPAPPSNEEMLASLWEQFGSVTPSPSKKPCLDITNMSPVNINSSLLDETADLSTVDTLFESSIDIKHQKNPFSKKSLQTQKPMTNSESKFGALSKFSRIRKTEVNDSCIVQSRYFGSHLQETEKVGSKDSDLPNSNTLLKEIQNLGSSPEKKSNTSLQLEKFIKNSPIKNNLEKFRSEINKSPIKIKSLFTALNVNKEINEKESSEINNLDKEEKKNLTNNNENITNSNNTASTFKWAKSMEDNFGFKVAQIKSSKAVSNAFRNPIKNCSLDTKSELITADIKGTKQKSKNPFKICQSTVKHSLGSQGSSCEDDSWEESEITSSSESPLSSLKSQKNNSILVTPPPTLTQCRNLGLSRKTTPSVGRQQNLLNMFGFNPKNKLQR